MDGDAQELEENAGDKLESNLQQFAEQSESFKQTQEEFKEYMKALQSDINEREKFMDSLNSLMPAFAIKWQRKSWMLMIM